ncbi:MAG TPA: DegT/DnrJ/EryC1/StrS family aminotransferase [Stellaceae bacterium]|jgi:perosamine synthetase
MAQPALIGNERDYVLKCLDDNWISSGGRFVGEFERNFAGFCNAKHGVATSNGTTALHLALVALGVAPGDEVIVPTLTYIATANSIRYCGATPVMVDSETETLNIDPSRIEERITPRTRGIIAVHLYGFPADMDPVMEIARRHKLFVIEDAAEAHGAEYRGRRVGGLGNCATFSFFGNKIITTGEGGMVTTNDSALDGKLRMYCNQGNDPGRRYWHPVIGYNYRMTNITASIGVAQVEVLDDLLAQRRQLAALYEERLERLRDRIEVLDLPSWGEGVFWMQNVFLREGGGEKRDAVIGRMAEAGIETRPVFHPMHTMPPYFESSHRFPVATAYGARGISLPTHVFLKEADLDRIIDALDASIA